VFPNEELAKEAKMNLRPIGPMTLDGRRKQTAVLFEFKGPDGNYTASIILSRPDHQASGSPLSVTPTHGPFAREPYDTPGLPTPAKVLTLVAPLVCKKSTNLLTQPLIEELGWAIGL
jgi:hypothetical protein